MPSLSKPLPPKNPANSKPLSPQEAEAQIRQFLQDNPQNASAWHQLGMVSARLGKRDQAFDGFRKAAELDPEQPVFRHDYASQLQAHGKPQEALSHFEAVVRLKPECGEAFNNLGIAQIQLGRREQAAASFAQAIRHKPDFPEAYNNAGNVLVEQGKPEEALAQFDQAIHFHPRYPDAWHNRGMALLRLGRTQEASASFAKAIELRPNYAEAHCQQGIALRTLGKLDEAVSAFRAAVKVRSDHPEARLQLISTLAQQSKPVDAALACHEALLFFPDHPDLYNHLGIALVHQEKMDEAIAAFRQSLRFKPDLAEAINNLGNALLRQNRYDEAIAQFQEALRVRPDLPQPLNNLAGALLQKGDAEGSVQVYLQALERSPEDAELHFNIDNAYRTKKSFPDAEKSYKKSLELKPDHLGARLNLGILHLEEGRFEEAVGCYEAVLVRKADHAEAYSCWGVACLHQGQPEEAIRKFDRAIEIDPQHADYHLNRALTRLSLGDYEQGWDEYEWRWKLKKAMPRPFHQPAWDGSDLPQGAILLYAEQGLGDTIQFIRYAPLVKAKVGKVLFDGPPILKGLLASCPGIDEIVEAGNESTKFDVHAPLLSLPRILGAKTETAATSVPYVFADPNVQSRWQQKAEKLGGLKVGIVWQGNPQYAGDRWRSIHLNLLASITEVPGTSVVSLQKGSRSEQLRDWKGPAIEDWADSFSADFRDVAAAVASLDLVIAVDTAVAHLAGAMGKPVWILIPFSSDWRWLRNRDDSIWYPSARLFRQTKSADWSDVVERVKRELQKLASHPRRQRVLVELELEEAAIAFARLVGRTAESDGTERLQAVRRRLADLALPEVTGRKWIDDLEAAAVAQRNAEAEFRKSTASKRKDAAIRALEAGERIETLLKELSK